MTESSLQPEGAASETKKASTKDLSAEKWHRLEPIAILYFIVKLIYQTVTQGLQAFLPAVAVFVSFTHDRLYLIIPIVSTILMLILAASILSYLKFRYRLTDSSVLIQSGVLKRKRLSIPFERIQNIAFREPIYFRPFGMVVLAIESAGSSAEEISLSGVKRLLAEKIRLDILSGKAKKTESSITAREEASKETDHISPQPDTDTRTLLRQPISELVRYGLSNNNIWVMAGLMAAAIGQLDWEDGAIIGSAEEFIGSMIATSSFPTSLFVAVCIVFLGLFLMLASIIGAIVVYYNFHLSRDHTRIHRTKGLFERQETSLSIKKIQCIILSKPWPAKLLKRYHVILKQVGFKSVNQQKAKQKAFIIPSTTMGFVKGFSQELYPNFKWDRRMLETIHPTYVRKILIWYIAPFALIPAISMTLSIGAVGLLFLLIPIVLWPVVARYRWMYRYASDGRHGIIQTGFIGHKLTIFPFYKVQTVELYTSPSQQRKGLASLKIKLAGTTLNIPYIPQKTAVIWRDAILFEVESTKTGWM